MSYSRSISEFSVIPPALNFSATDNRKRSTCSVATTTALDSRRETYVYCLRRLYISAISRIESRRNSAGYNPQLRKYAISNTACAFARASARTRTHTRVRSAPPRVSLDPDPSDTERQPRVPSLVRWNKCTGVGFWRVIVRTITRCQPTGRRGWKRSYGDLELAGRGWRGDRLGFAAGEGQECVLKGPALFEESRCRGTSNSACLPKGPIVVPGAVSRVPQFPACHARSPVALPRFLVCFRRERHSEDPPPQDRA